MGENLMIMSIIVIACVGLVLSMYSFFVEQKIKADPSYKPACDLSDMISCSRPMQSQYAKLFKISNSILGLLFYIAMIVLGILDYAQLAFILSCAGVVASMGFAYLLYFKIRSLCLVCTSLYIVNILLLIASYRIFAGG